MTPVTDPTTLQSPADPPQFKPSVITESVDLNSKIGAPQASIRLDPTLKNPVSAAEHTDKLSLTEDLNSIEPEGTDEGMNIKSLAGMLNDLKHCPD